MGVSRLPMRELTGAQGGINAIFIPVTRKATCSLDRGEEAIPLKQDESVIIYGGNGVQRVHLKKNKNKETGWFKTNFLVAGTWNDTCLIYLPSGIPVLGVHQT